MQQAISHTSGSLAVSARRGEKLVNSSMSAVNTTRHTAICLNVFAVIAFQLGEICRGHNKEPVAGD
jgi:hypothetical protein